MYRLFLWQEESFPPGPGLSFISPPAFPSLAVLDRDRQIRSHLRPSALEAEKCCPAQLIDWHVRRAGGEEVDFCAELYCKNLKAEQWKLGPLGYLCRASLLPHPPTYIM